MGPQRTGRGAGRARTAGARQMGTAREQSHDPEQETQGRVGPEDINSRWDEGLESGVAGVGGSSGRPAPPTCAGLGPCGIETVFFAVSQAPRPRTRACGLGHRLPAPGRTPKLHGPRCPARRAPYLAGAVLRRRWRGGWAAQSHIVPGRGGRSQLRVTSAANNEGFDRRGARPARSPAPRPPTPTPQPARPGPSPPPPRIRLQRGGPAPVAPVPQPPAPPRARGGAPRGGRVQEGWATLRPLGVGGDGGDRARSAVLRRCPRCARSRVPSSGQAARPAPLRSPLHPHPGLLPAASPRLSGSCSGRWEVGLPPSSGSGSPLSCSAPSTPARGSGPPRPAPLGHPRLPRGPALVRPGQVSGPAGGGA